MPFIDTSAIVNGNPIQAPQVKTPLDTLDGVLTNLFAGNTNKFTSALFAEQASIGTVSGTDGKVYLKSDGLYLKTSVYDRRFTTTNDFAVALPIGNTTANTGAFTILTSQRSTITPATNGLNLVVNNVAALPVFQLDTFSSEMTVRNNGNTASATINGVGAFASILQYRQANNTLATPNATLANDFIGMTNYIGHTGTSYTSPAAIVLTRALEPFTTTAAGVNIEFRVCSVGSVSPSLSLTVGGSRVLVSGACEIDGELDHDGTTVGFYNNTPITKPTVTGARGGNTALASLLTQLAALGLVTDSTTA